MLAPAKVVPENGSLPNYPFTEFAAYGLPNTREEARLSYKDGLAQKSLEARARRRRWRVTHRLSAAELQTMRDFYKAHLLQPFNFVDQINDMAFRAVFTGTFQERCNTGYVSISVELLEIV